MKTTFEVTPIYEKENGKVTIGKPIDVTETRLLPYFIGHALCPKDDSFAIEFENVIREILYGPKYVRRQYDVYHLP